MCLVLIVIVWFYLLILWIWLLFRLWCSLVVWCNGWLFMLNLVLRYLRVWWCWLSCWVVSWLLRLWVLVVMCLLVLGWYRCLSVRLWLVILMWSCWRLMRLWFCGVLSRLWWFSVIWWLVNISLRLMVGGVSLVWCGWFWGRSFCCWFGMSVLRSVIVNFICSVCWCRLSSSRVLLSRFVVSCSRVLVVMRC